jgi:hypothetical protein
MGAKAFTAVLDAHCGRPPPGFACAIMVIWVFDGSSGDLERTAANSAAEEMGENMRSPSACALLCHDEPKIATYSLRHAVHNHDMISPPSPWPP